MFENNGTVKNASFINEAPPDFIGQIPPEPTLAQANNPVTLDASILDMQEMWDAVREDVKQNRIEFIFPAGLAQLDLLEECRALTRLDDFDTMYDLTMQMLEKKPIIINLINLDDSKTELCNFYVVDKYMNLRGIDAINQYPCLVAWLTEFIAAYISKKSPMPGDGQTKAQASETKSSKRPNKQKVSETTS